jgi:SAM-dependent methyltransferase
MTNLNSDRSRVHRSRWENHWNGLAESLSHTGLKSGYHLRIQELYRHVISPGQSILEIGCAKGDLLAALAPVRGVGVDFSPHMVFTAKKRYPSLEFIHGDAQDLSAVTGPFDYIIFSDLIDDLWDVQSFMEQLHRLCTPSTRIVFNVYSHLWSLPLRLAQKLGLATPMLPQNWLTHEDISGLLHLSGFDLVSHRTDILFPLNVPVIAPFCNRYLSKFMPFSLFNLTHIFVARHVQAVPVKESSPKVSVIVPARNEAGNIAQILDRIPPMGSAVEVVFVEGGSSDGTYEVIETEINRHPEIDSRVFKQVGNGKGDAVRLGFERATGDILMILDADLTVAPEDLDKFYRALVEDKGEFINGVRLVYPMHDKAMRFFNLVGNKFFSMAFTWLLDQKVKDTLCGTKSLWKRDYLRLAAQRSYFGEFDPFGDFDLLFGASRLNLKIVDLPVRYGNRTYGSTNISRWTHGWLLLRMLFFAARRLKFT